MVRGAVAIREDDFGALGDGRRVTRFTLETETGLRAQILDYGGTVVSLEVPDRAGRRADVVLGYDDLAGYTGGEGYFGALVGRHANRIARGRFALDGAPHQLSINDGANHLHGGTVGFDRAVWRATPHDSPAGPALALEHTSPDGDQGYPGALTARATYTLERDALRIDYAATCDRDTIVNLTSHIYWNLAGHAAGSILEHQLVLDAARFAVAGTGQIPTGELRPVAGTPFDFRDGAVIGSRIDAPDPQVQIGVGGYDHSFELGPADGAMRRAARVTEPSSGRVLEIHTTEPAIQLYSGNHLNGMRGKAGATYPRRTGFCLETQHHPDAPNHPAFATTLLRAGATYRTTTIHRFQTD